MSLTNIYVSNVPDIPASAGGDFDNPDVPDSPDMTDGLGSGGTAALLGYTLFFAGVSAGGRVANVPGQPPVITPVAGLPGTWTAAVDLTGGGSNPTGAASVTWDLGPGYPGFSASETLTGGISTAGSGGGGDFDNPDVPDSPDMTDGLGAPTAAIPGTPVLPGQVLYTCKFTFPPQPGQAGNVNDGQTVTTLVLDSAGNPVIIGGAAQAATTTGVVGVGNGSNQYFCLYACPPGFTGSAMATLASGPNAGQACAAAINLGAAVDLSAVSWSATDAQTRLSDPNSNTAPAGSDVTIYIPLRGEKEDGTLADPTGNPVAVAVTLSDPGVFDILPATWGGSAAGGTLFARLKLSVLAGTALSAGYYLVTALIDGTTRVNAPGALEVVGGYGDFGFSNQPASLAAVS